LASTIYDIAAKAGVSIATVSRVFNQSTSVSQKTRNKVLKVAESVGYHPQAYAQGLASKKLNTIMAVVPVMSNYFFMEILGGIQDKLTQLGYELSIFNVTGTGDSFFEQVEHVIRRRAAEGYLFISIHLNPDQWDKLQKYPVPITLVDEFYDGFDSVSVDNVQGAYTATKTLLDAGYKRVGMISALESSKPIKDRIKGYRLAFEESEIPLDSKLIVCGDTDYRDGFTERGGYTAMQQMIELHSEVDACFCSSDIQAVGALKAMEDLELSIPLIGYDDIEISEYIGLSTVRQPMRDMGSIATQTLLDRMKNEGKAISQTMYSPQLILRKSTNGILKTSQK
jgi:LacI family transcriptional regulator